MSLSTEGEIEYSSSCNNCGESTDEETYFISNHCNHTNNVNVKRPSHRDSCIYSIARAILITVLIGVVAFTPFIIFLWVDNGDSNLMWWILFSLIVVLSCIFIFSCLGIIAIEKIYC